MELTLLDFFDILSAEVAAVQSSTTAITNFEPGSVARAILESMASQALWLQAQNYSILQTTRAATSAGSDLDTFCADYGLTRLPASYATGVATFSRLTSTLAAVLYPGLMISTGDLTQSYIVGVDTSNAAWNQSLNGYQVAAGVSSLSVPITALNAGTQANVLANTITLIQSGCSFDAVTNPSPVTSGMDAESDASLRAQFTLYINSRSKATIAAVMFATLSVQTGLTCDVNESVDSGGNYLPGNFVVVVDDGSGNPPSSLISAVYAAVNAIRAATISFSVQAPTVVHATIVMTITVASGYQKSAITPLVQSALTNYISALPVGQPFHYSMIPNIAYNTSAGIINVSSITLNGGTSDLGGTPFVAVRPATITIN